MDSTQNLADRDGDFNTIPIYDKYGRRLEERERKKYAETKGYCYPCGRVIYKPKLFGKKTLITNDDVYEGICINCHQEMVPKDVREAWERKYKPATARKPKLYTAVNTIKNMNRLGQAGQSDRGPSSNLAHLRRDKTSLSERGPSSPDAQPRPIQSNHESDSRFAMQDVLFADQPGDSKQPASKKGGNSSMKKVLTSPKPSASRNHVRRTSENSASSSREVNDMNVSSSSLGSRGTRRHPKSRNTGSGGMDESERSMSSSAPFQEDLDDSYRLSHDPNNRSSNRKMGWDDFEAPKLGLSSAQIAERLQAEDEQRDESALRKTLHALRNEYISGHEEVVGSIKNLMLANDSNAYSRILDVACGALWRMSADDLEAKRHIVESGTIAVVVEAIATNRYDPEFPEWAMGTVMSVAVEVDHKQYVSEMNAIQSILDTLAEHDEKATVFEWSCRCLYTLLVIHQDEGESMQSCDILSRNIASIEDFHGIPTIIGAMRKHERESHAQNVAIHLLWRLLDVDPATRRKTIRRLSEAGIVQLLTRLFKLPSTSAGVFDCAAELLCTILSTEKDHPVLSESMGECIPSVVRRMERSPNDEIIQKAGLRVLAAAIVLGEVPFKTLEESAVAKVVIDALNILDTDPMSIESGLLLMWKFSSYKAEQLLDYQNIIAALNIMTRITLSDKLTLEKFCAIYGFVVNSVQTKNLQLSDLPLRALLSVTFDDQLTEDTAWAIVSESMPTICYQFPEFGNEAVDCMVEDSLLDDIGKGSFERLLPLARTVKAVGGRKELDVPEGLLAGVIASIPHTDDPALLKEIMDFVIALVKSSRAESVLAASAAPTLVTLFRNHQGDFDLCRHILDAVAHICRISKGTIDCRSVAKPILECFLSADVDDDTQEVASLAMWSLLANNSCTDAELLSQIYNYTIRVLDQFVGDTAEAFDQDTVETTCGVLAAVAALVRTAPIPISQPDVDVLVSIIYLSMELSRSPLIPILVLEALFHFCLLDESVLIQCGAIVVVADSIQKFNNEPRILEGGFALLSQLASSENIHINLSIVFSDGVDSILHGMTLNPGHSGIQMYGCKAFSHLSIEGETRMVICEQGGLALIVTSLKSHHDDEELAEYACSALLNLTSDSPPQAIEGTDIVDKIVQLLEQYPRNPSIRRNCLGILQNISMKGPDAKSSIARSGGLDAVVQTISQQTDPPDVLERAFTTLWSLAVLGENRGRILASGGIDHAILTMLSFVEYEGVQQQACGCLCTLAMDQLARKVIRKAGGCDALLLAMRIHYGSCAVQNEAARTISIVYDPDCEEGEATAMDDLVDAVLMAMRKFPVDMTLQTRCCAALSSMLLCPAGKIQGKHDEIRRQVQAVSTHFPDALGEAVQDILNLLAA